MENNLEKTNEKKVKLKREVKTPSKKVPELVYNFDSFFQILLKENKNIAKHHKAPIRSWVERAGLKEGTLKQFYEAFKGY